MYLLFDENGKFLAGRVLSSTDSSTQVELDSGKRVKVKSANALLTFEKPSPAELVAQATTMAETVDLALAWECASDEDFGFAQLAGDYFNPKPSAVEQAAALFSLHGAPHYFRRAGKGRFRRAGADVVAQALLAIERRKAQLAQVALWSSELTEGRCPASVREHLYKILFKPDKNATEYRAVVEAARTAGLGPLVLLQRAGAIDSAYQFHWQRFLFDAFPKGYKFPSLIAPEITAELPLADVLAFSIDDSSTTEIDDALSITGLGSGSVVLGIHIAAPGLAIVPDSPLDRVARERMSTVYMPGNKLTMLPDEVVQGYTLSAGRACPAVSLYVTFDEASLSVTATRTVLERVPMEHNLRHDQLDGVVTEAWLSLPAGSGGLAPNHVLSRLSNHCGHRVLRFLHELANSLKAQREVVRGKPENFNRPDYNFKLLGTPGAAPVGDERVEITARVRGSPLDLIVAECMILANSTWGEWLASFGIPAIYRSQASLAPGVKVRMGTKVLPHAGIGVRCYAWSTSPLRRYTDLVNQWQIIAAAKHGATAALAAPFKPKDAGLFAIISQFDTAYTSYNGFQTSMERYWTLKALQQQGVTTLEAVVVKDFGGVVVRADAWPLVCSLSGSPELARGSRVRIALGEIDLMALNVTASFVERLGGPAAGEPGSVDGDDGDLDVNAGPLALAMDINEPDTDARPRASAPGPAHLSEPTDPSTASSAA